MRLAALLPILLVLAAPAMGQTLPGLVGPGIPDPRHPVDTAIAPWQAVARLQIPGVSRCTAALVGPSLALTAAHCLYSVRLGHFAPAEAIHVLTGYAAGAARQAAIGTAIRVAPGYDPRRPGSDRDADFAWVALSRPLLPAAASLTLLDRPPQPGEPAMLGGYSQDRAEIMTADTGCHLSGSITFAGATLLLHDCAGTRGTSGAPLLVHTQTGWAVAGLEVAAASGHAAGLAIPAAVLGRLAVP